MARAKVLIAESTEEFRLALAELLQEEYQVRSCEDGKEALALLHSFRPDVMVLDMMLSQLDSISLLQNATAAGICPVVLATTRYYTPYLSDSTTLWGIQYVMRKPCDLRATVERIGDLVHLAKAAPVKAVDPSTHVDTMLLSLNIPSKLNGYSYLRQAILSIAKHPGQSLTKELYPHIGTLFGVEKANVERSIRNAIASAWGRRDEQVWLQYFPPDADGALHRPTNSAFISRLATALNLTLSAGK